MEYISSRRSNRNMTKDMMRVYMIREKMDRQIQVHYKIDHIILLGNGHTVQESTS